MNKKSIAFFILLLLGICNVSALQISGNLTITAPTEIKIESVLRQTVLTISLEKSGEFESDKVDIVPDVYHLVIGSFRELVFLENINITVNGTINATNPAKSQLEFNGIETNNTFELILQKYIRNDMSADVLAPYIIGGKFNPQAATSFYYAAMSKLKKPVYIYENAKDAYDMLPADMEANPSHKWVKNIVDSTARYRIGGPAPDFTFENIEGQKVSLSDFKGKYVVLDFWASWCGPCIREIEHIKKFYPEFEARDDVAFISVSMDDTKKSWQTGLDRVKIPWIALWEYALPGQTRDNWFNYTSLKTEYGFRSIPFVVIIDKEGNYVARSIKGNDIKNRLNSLLR